MQNEAQLDEVDLSRILLQRLESLQRAGVTHLPKTRVPIPRSGGFASSKANASPAARAATSPPANASVQTTAAPAPTAQSSTSAPASPPTPAIAASPTSGLFEQPGASGSGLPLADRQAALASICQEVAGCVRCKHLAATRRQTVFGVGNPQARLCFIGEAPGADEDAQGIPFVGRAGQLLTKIIEACTLSRDEVYILNVLKCRPPENRTPTTEEVDNCRGYLERQLEIIRPEFICCLGGTAAKALLNLAPTVSMGSLRGRFHRYGSIPVLCTYHPSYLLRNPAAKRDVWEDMKLLMREMGVELK